MQSMNVATDGCIWRFRNEDGYEYFLKPPHPALSPSGGEGFLDAV